MQPPFFSTGLPHLGHGFVLAVIQFLFSLSPWILLSHSRHLARAQIALDTHASNSLEIDTVANDRCRCAEHVQADTMRWS